jgi:hypothetical protein
MSGKPEFRQKVRHGLDAVHGNATEFDPGCPRQLAIVPENPQHGFSVVRRMRGSSHVRLCLFTGRARYQHFARAFLVPAVNYGQNALIPLLELYDLDSFLEGDRGRAQNLLVE